MKKHLVAACIVCSSLGWTTVRCSAQNLTVTGSPEIADTIALLFDEIAEATAALDVDRLLTYYREGGDLTYVAQGRVVRSFEAFSEILDTQLRGLRAAELQWLDTYVDVLSSDVAVATATYELVAMLPAGDSVRTTGTYMCIYVKREGLWQVTYSAHSFPPRTP